MLSVGKILMLGLEFQIVKFVATSPRSRYMGFVFQWDLCFFTVIFVTWRVCPQDQNFSR